MMSNIHQYNHTNGNGGSPRVHVHSKLTVVSSRPTEPLTMTHPLSVLDHAMGNHTLHIVFYYKNRSGFDFDQLRPSLNEILSMYPTVTGRFPKKDGDGNWYVRCNDAGVRLLKANVKGVGIDEWLTSADVEKEMDLTVWDDMPCDDPYIWSPFRIQVTEFEGGGLAIGLSCTHLLADPTCATLLINSWTECHRREASLSHPPFIHPPALQPRSNPNLLDTADSAQFYASKGSSFTTSTTTAQPQSKKMSTATFSFPDSSIRNSLLKINTDSHHTNVSPFDFLAALFWTQITQAKAKAKGSSSISNHQECYSLTICTDFRNLLHAHLPYEYFGNAISFTKLDLCADVLEGGDVGQVAKMVNNHISGLKEEDFMSSIDWFNSRKDENGKFPSPFRMYGPELTCVSMEHMILVDSQSSGKCGDAGIGSKCESLMYMAKFDKDEMPVHVSYRIGNVGGEQGEDEGLILVMPSPEGGMGRRVTVTLPEEEMISLCDDQGISSLEPNLLLCE